MSRDAHPLVVTLAIDPSSQRRFDAERSRLFPVGRTVVGAHVTLFHALPGASSDRVVAALDVPVAPFDVAVTGVYSLGRGVAYRLSSAALMSLHDSLRAAWLPLLTPQDAQPFRPHVTVQNKVSPEIARATLAELGASFTPHHVSALGLDLWRYDDGPWTHLRRFVFTQ